MATKIVRNKMARQFRVVVSLLTDIKFKRKERLRKTLSKVISELNGIAPIDMIGVEDSVGKLYHKSFSFIIIYKSLLNLYKYSFYTNLQIICNYFYTYLLPTS